VPSEVLEVMEAIYRKIRGYADELCLKIRGKDTSFIHVHEAVISQKETQAQKDRPAEKGPKG
jgi:hypothetical protein